MHDQISKHSSALTRQSQHIEDHDNELRRLRESLAKLQTELVIASTATITTAPPSFEFDRDTDPTIFKIRTQNDVPRAVLLTTLQSHSTAVQSTTTSGSSRATKSAACSPSNSSASRCLRPGWPASLSPGAEMRAGGRRWWWKPLTLVRCSSGWMWTNRGSSWPQNVPPECS